MSLQRFLQSRADVSKQAGSHRQYTITACLDPRHLITQSSNGILFLSQRLHLNLVPVLGVLFWRGISKDVVHDELRLIWFLQNPITREFKSLTGPLGSTWQHVLHELYDDKLRKVSVRPIPSVCPYHVHSPNPCAPRIYVPGQAQLVNDKAQ